MILPPARSPSCATVGGKMLLLEDPMVSVAFSLALPEQPVLAASGAVVPAPDTVAEDIAPPTRITLRVSGGKPLKMRAQLMAEGSSWSPGTPAWHEVAVYRRELGEYAVAVKTFKKSVGEKDVFRAEVFPNIDEVMAWIEGFDPTADMTIDLDASDRSIRSADIALRAAALRLRSDEITRQFQALVGELLFRLDAIA